MNAPNAETYVDSSLIVRLYSREPGWADVVELVQTASAPLPLTFLHVIEVSNALRRGLFEQRITSEQCIASEELFADDITTGLFRRLVPDIDELTRRAATLGSTWAPTLGVRTLDVLHVALALGIGARRFLSGDIRQRQLAHNAGLSIQ